jgi:hypothetical protein
MRFDPKQSRVEDIERMLEKARADLESLSQARRIILSCARNGEERRKAHNIERLISLTDGRISELSSRLYWAQFEETEIEEADDDIVSRIGNGEPVDGVCPHCGADDWLVLDEECEPSCADCANDPSWR